MTSVRPLLPAPLWREHDRRERIVELARDGHQVEQALVRVLADVAERVDVPRHLVEQVAAACRKRERLGALGLAHRRPAGVSLLGSPRLGRLLGLDHERQQRRLDGGGLDAERLRRAPRKLAAAPRRVEVDRVHVEGLARASPSPSPAAGRAAARLHARVIAERRRARARAAARRRRLDGFSLKGERRTTASRRRRRASRLGRVEELRGRPRAASPLRETSSSFASLIPAGKRRDAHRDARPPPASPSVRPSPSCPASSLSSARIDALHALALQQVQVIRREAVRAVDRDRGRDAGLVERQRVEDDFGEDDLVARARGLEVQDAAQRARAGSSAAASSPRGRRGSSTGR